MSIHKEEIQKYISLYRLTENIPEAAPAFDANSANPEDKVQQWEFYFANHVEEVIEILEASKEVLNVSLSWLKSKMPAFAEAMASNETMTGSYVKIGNKQLRKLFLEGHEPQDKAHIRFSDNPGMDEIAKAVLKEELKTGTALLLSPEPLVKINKDLESRICHDNILKNVVFMVGISAYGQNPLNLFLEGPSSTGKTYVVLETLKYFPAEDVWNLGGLSATALVHDRGEKEEINGETFKVVDLSEKILVFLEKPNLATLKRLLPILSHDVDEIEYRITDKNAKGQHATMKVVIRGFPAVIFCTTESETLKDLSTRNMLYAPEVTKDKITEVIELQKNAATKPWKIQATENDIQPQVQDAIKMIKDNYRAAEVAIPDIEAIKMEISTDPRIMRDYKKRLELIKSCTRLHAYQRYSLEYSMGGIEHKVILADFFDILLGLTLFDEIELSTTTGLAPAVIDFFNNILKPLRNDLGTFNYIEMQAKYFEVYTQAIGSDTIRKHRINPLEQAGYVTSDYDEKDKRKKYFAISRDIPTPQITGKKRRFDIGDSKELERGEIWIKNALEIPDVKLYMYRGKYNNINPSDFSRDSNSLYQYLYTPSSIRYFQNIFPQFGALSKDEISGIFKSPQNVGNSDTKSTEKEALGNEESPKNNEENPTEGGEGSKKESPPNADNLEEIDAKARAGISIGEDIDYEKIGGDVE